MSTWILRGSVRKSVSVKRSSAFPSIRWFPHSKFMYCSCPFPRSQIATSSTVQSNTDADAMLELSNKKGSSVKVHNHISNHYVCNIITHEQNEPSGWKMLITLIQIFKDHGSKSIPTLIHFTFTSKLNHMTVNTTTYQSTLPEACCNSKLQNGS